MKGGAEAALEAIADDGLGGQAAGDDQACLLRRTKDEGRRTKDKGGEEAGGVKLAVTADGLEFGLGEAVTFRKHAFELERQFFFFLGGGGD